MSEQHVTPELRQWIIDQAKASRPPDEVLQSMLASGWNEDTALAALEDTLASFLKENSQALGLPAPVPVPEPDLAEAPTTLTVDGHEISIVMTLRNPRVVVFGNLLTHDECDELVALAGRRLSRSETVVTSTGSSEVNVARTSDGMFFERGENAMCQRIEARIAALLDWPIENGEGLQILRYRPGAEYKPHYDYFDPSQPGTPTILKRGGQRVATLVAYLNTPERGGATTFPDVNLEVAPVKGNAVFFSYERAHPMTRTLHGGAPVLAGEKWVATKWLREGRFT
jgi:prolyl 4-hydroxylase